MKTSTNKQKTPTNKTKQKRNKQKNNTIVTSLQPTKLARQLHKATN